ncbi:MAG: lysophospholipid acyltransferase family protein [Congregibacter sp.]
MPSSGAFVGDLSNRGDTRVRPSRIKTSVVVILLSVWCVVLPLLYFFARAFRLPFTATIYKSFHGGVRRLFNLRTQLVGFSHAGSPTLYVCNHVSYLDVFVLGEVLDIKFVAKAEVANWPVLGKLAALQNTLFFERDPRRAREQLQALQSQLQQGHSLMLFPEGTSTPGDRVEPFHASLFEAGMGDDSKAVIQPVSIAYVDYDGVPMSPADRDHYAWYLPMSFLGHFLTAMGLRQATVVVEFHQAVDGRSFSNRKAAAAYCEEQVRHGLMRALGQGVEGS